MSLWQVDSCIVLRCPITAGWLSLDLQAAAQWTNVTVLVDSTLIYGTTGLMFSSRTSETSASPVAPLSRNFLLPLVGLYLVHISV